jgi:hypothetical protein
MIMTLNEVFRLGYPDMLLFLLLVVMYLQIQIMLFL